MSEQEMGAWYFWWHRMLGVPYSDDLLKRMEEERMRRLRQFVNALTEGIVFMALLADELPKKPSGRRKKPS